jgi:hypothetical protein
MKPKADQRGDLAPDQQGRPSGEGHRPDFESAQHAEWRVNDGGSFVLRLDRISGEWSGEQMQGGAGTANPLSPHEVELMVRARDLRFRDGTRAG